MVLVCPKKPNCFTALASCLLVFVIAALVYFNLRLKESAVGFRQPSSTIHFETIAGISFGCPFQEEKDCLGGEVIALSPERDVLVFQTEKEVEFFSGIVGEVTYSKVGLGSSELERAVFYPSLLMESMDRPGYVFKYIFSGDAVSGLRLVKEGDRVGITGQSFEAFGATGNLFVYVEKNGKWVRGFLPKTNE